jgi:hypothetical protein
MLACYEHNGVMYSEAAEFLAYLVNGEWQKFPLPKAEIKDVLTTSRPFFGKSGLMSLKTPTQERYASILAVQEYPAMTQPGLLNELLAMPFELVISQSFTFLSKPVAVGRMQRQHGRMVNAGDLAKSQINAIHDALDDLISIHAPIVSLSGNADFKPSNNVTLSPHFGASVNTENSQVGASAGMMTQVSLSENVLLKLNAAVTVANIGDTNDIGMNAQLSITGQPSGYNIIFRLDFCLVITFIAPQ